MPGANNALHAPEMKSEKEIFLSSVSYPQDALHCSLEQALGQLLNATMSAEFDKPTENVTEEGVAIEGAAKEKDVSGVAEAVDASGGVVDALGTVAESTAETAPEPPKKRGRGRPRKGEVLRSVVESAETLRRSQRRAVAERVAYDTKTAEKTLRAQERPKKEPAKSLGTPEHTKKKRDRFKQEMELLAESGSESEGFVTCDSYGDVSSSQPDDSDEEEYRERKRPQKLRAGTVSRSTSRSPKKPQKLTSAGDTIAKEAKSPMQRRTKKGRPSRQENVARRIFSIFKTDGDDPALEVTEKAPPQEAPRKAPESTSTRTVAIALNFDNKGASTFSDIPIVSGIKNPEPAHEDATEAPTKFVPMPVPEVDNDGRIVDASYAETYLPGVVLPNNDGSSGRLIDERAYFLEGSEGYFEQHNLRFRPSASSLALNAPALGFEEYGPLIELGRLVHRQERDALAYLHRSLYHQWCFELSQGYSLNFFGVGSKTKVIMDFVEDYFVSWYRRVICEDMEQMPPVMVINGYNPGAKLKAVLHDMTSAVLATSFATTTSVDDSRFQPRMPKHVSEAFPFLTGHLKRQGSRNTTNRVTKASLVLVIHNLDGEGFRDQRSQNLLSELALLPNVWVIASTDNINLGLLWDLNRFKNFNFLWHNVTSYEPYTVELSFKDLLSMGKSKKFVGSRGASYVLASLTANAKKLYQVILEMQMATLNASVSTKTGVTGLKGSPKNSVELRAVYEKCVEGFIVSNEVNFKTMLGEYVEHKMCALTKDTGGQEVVYVPFTFDEMAKLLREEFGAGDT